MTLYADTGPSHRLSPNDPVVIHGLADIHTPLSPYSIIPI